MGNLFSKSKKPLNYQTEVELAHFNLLRSIGKGAFGKVRVVEKKDTKKLYALKYINKARCIKQKAVHNTLRERFILQEIDHPFVVNLRYAFQDDENMFVVLDLKTGGSLRYHLDRLGSFALDEVQFIAAEIAVALKYLHRKRIVHRDIKPDNILIDDFGHMHLTDFNIAARLEEGKYLTSQSGTLIYMAPEMFTKRGYATGVDFWALGIVLYECVYGHVPFRQDTEEALIRELSTGDASYRPYGPGEAKRAISADCMSMLQGFLVRDKHRRLGATANPIEAHPFFAGLSWTDVEAKRVAAPFVPDAKSMNFDPTHELEELLLEENPLTVKPRKRKPRKVLADYATARFRGAETTVSVPNLSSTAAAEAISGLAMASPTAETAPAAGPGAASVTPVVATTAEQVSRPQSAPVHIVSHQALTVQELTAQNLLLLAREKELAAAQRESALTLPGGGAEAVSGNSRRRSTMPAGGAHKAGASGASGSNSMREVGTNSGTNRKHRKEEEPLSVEMQLIEDGFLSFDFEKREIYLRIAESVIAESGNNYPTSLVVELNAMLARERSCCDAIAVASFASSAAQRSTISAEESSGGINATTTAATAGAAGATPQQARDEALATVPASPAPNLACIHEVDAPASTAIIAAKEGEGAAAEDSHAVVDLTANGPDSSAPAAERAAAQA